MAQAFTKSTLKAALALPLALITVVPYVMRKQVYESSDGQGMVIFGRFSRRSEILIGAVLVIPVIILVNVMIAIWGPFTGLIFAAVLAVILILGVLAMGRDAVSGMPVGKETPKGQRWQMAALAQRPGTQQSAVRLAHRLLESLPAGAVVVATAASIELQEAYARYGFEKGSAGRVYLRVD